MGSGVWKLTTRMGTPAARLDPEAVDAVELRDGRDRRELDHQPVVAQCPERESCRRDAIRRRMREDRAEGCDAGKDVGQVVQAASKGCRGHAEGSGEP